MKKAHKRRHHSESSCSDSSTSDSETKKRIKKLKRKLKKEQNKKEKILKKRIKAEKKKMRRLKKASLAPSESSDDFSKSSTTDIPIELMEKSKAMAPMTKEEWDQRQSVIRRVVDPETGRHRLIKGDGEVLEEIVSRDRHKEINRQATRADGEFFQAQTTLNRLQ